MPLFDLADPHTPLPMQLVADTSLLLALRKGDDNPHAQAAYRFIERLGRAVANRTLILWLPTAVLQECYHIILSHALRRAWAASGPATRPPNWLPTNSSQNCWQPGLPT